MTLELKWNSFKYIDYLDVKNNEIKNLPSGISISTMCASCKLNTSLNIPNIEKYLQLSSDDILTVKMNKERMKTLIAIKKKTKRVKNVDTKVKTKDTSKNHFYNQVTVVVRINQGMTDDLNTEPKINMKLFKNGSVQMSGCKSVDGINRALNKLIEKLKEVKGKFEDGKVTDIQFIDEPNEITVKKFKIDMINSNYRVNMLIDREKLYNLLVKKHIKSSYEPCIRACVIIKYKPIEKNIEEKEMSIFIFQKGNIIITGARSQSHIESSYAYMNNILLSHTEDITKKDEKQEENLILDLYSDIMKEVNIGLLKI